ncbi:MAG: PQQ-dependent sugar dehydrogenase [bacterium]
MKSHLQWFGSYFVLPLILLSTQATMTGAQEKSVPEGVWVRDGYQLTVAVDSINAPRFMEVNPDGVLFVSVPRPGEIKACRDEDNDGYYEKVTTFVEGYPQAHGMQWHDGWLWFTVSTAIHKARDTDGDGKADEVETVLKDLPGGTGHWWRSILIHNNRLYTSVGDPGNATPDDMERKKLWSYNLDGSDKKLFASGIRNTEKYAVRPGTDEFWGMDHNSDWFGRALEGEGRNIPQPITDRLPGEELNKYEEGKFYGHPFIVGKGIPRYEFMDREDIVELASKTTVPEWVAGAHWAANGMCFYTGDQFPEEVKGDAFIAYHGSWNSSVKVGYCVTRILFEDGHPFGELKYVNFLTDEEEVLGRPVDCEVAADGSLLISDDNGDMVYRLSYKN